ncbi:Glycosyltransferase involved in cell wall bisynthesis [Actinokineospora alba]|uniref:Glycosyltransferase involved in cell wall bisynthesis n=1 Tax=Actinokineospora alba TaxID=504798 RepID=A0A1H0U9U1_9PSEU|nr:glycosyltransferase family 1 protein [Actinokineospora alba]TDP65242.1 glycosyltransferase involved in cell wall biosynthesis [Actinokineospora alba]SDH57620.1 Glycosyltransferase involved in cell wall bisynthesis [Actinokineospora alba]SDP62944.1 Glycosyltransferase involved in cell wall bisynthesis [Actinokineospora alba]
MPELVVLTEQLLAPVPGGTGRYTRELAAALARTAPAGWTVRGVTARHGDLAPAMVDGVAGPSALALPRRALTLAWEHGLPLWPGGDIVHAPTPLAPPARRGRRLVVTVHDTVPFTHPETLTSRGAAWHRKVIRRAASSADAIVVPTQAVADDLALHAPGPAPVHVVGHGVSSVLSDPPAVELGLPSTYVLAVGTVEPRKGLDVLVEAMAAVPGVPLVVAGPAGWGEVNLAALAARHGLPPERLRVLGRLSDEELAATLHGATVLAAPSRAEGFGLPVLEAMAAGVPVVHSDAPALVEVAGGAGTQVKRDDPAALADALRTVLDSPDLAATMVERGRARAAEFTWKRAAESLWRLHRSLLGGAS